jgi:DNA-binding transcriptional regulator PaaX
MLATPIGLPCMPPLALSGSVSEVGKPAHAVLLVIAARVSDRGVCASLSVETISELVDKSVGTVRRAIETLKMQGLLSVQREGRQSVYRVTPSGTPPALTPDNSH